jgi:predicted protein tyrosine phosphatase
VRVVLGPHMLGVYLVRRWHRLRQRSPWDAIGDSIILGATPSAREMKTLVRLCQPIAWLDITAEHSAPAHARESNYLNVPVLDMTAPSPADIQQAVEFIAMHAPRGRVYVWCGFGYSRSAAVAAAYLLATGNAANVQDACHAVARARPGAIIRKHVQRQIEEFQMNRVADGSATDRH